MAPFRFLLRLRLALIEFNLVVVLVFVHYYLFVRSLFL